MLSRRIPITDHRGSAFLLWERSLIPVPAADDESRADARSARRIVWRNIDPKSKRRIRWMFCGGLLLAAALGIEILFVGRWHSRVQTLYWALYLAFGIHTTWRAAISARSAAVCSDLLARFLCPSCGYHLHGLAPEPDTCTTCPECGAAWKLP